MNALPAYLQNRQSRGLADQLTANLGVGSPPYVSIMANKFTLIDAVGAEEPVATYDPKTGPFLDCCIVDVGDHISRIYYDKPFDPSAGAWSPPDCWSDNGVGPSRNAALPQSQTTCAACPKAVWGSATSRVSGKGVPACGSYQKLALVIPGDDVVFLMRVPPNSLTNLREYVYKFTGKDTDISDVVTRISFEQGQIGTLVFNAINYIDEPTFKLREQARIGKATDALVGRTDQARPAIAGAPAPALAAPSAVLVTPNQPVVIVPPPEAGQAQSAPEQPARRRRRNAAQAQPEQPAQSQQAPFRPNPAPAGNAGFGMTASVPPNPEVQAAVDSLFK